MVAADYDREGATLCDFLDNLSEFVEVPMQIHRKDVDIATVGHGDAPQQLFARLDVIETLCFLTPAKGVA